MNCTPTQFNLSYFHYEPRVNSMETRRRKFRIDCRKALIELGWYSEEEFPTRLRNQWVDKWEASNGKKMAFEREKIFDIKARLRTFRRNDKNWNPRLWEKEKKETYKQPKKSNTDYGHQNYEAAKKRMNQDVPISEIMGAGSRLKSSWDS